MFKSRRNPYYYGKRRQSRNVSPLIIVASVAIALIALELIVRICVGIAGATDQLVAYQGEPEIVTSYRLNFLSQNTQPFDALSNQGKLLMKRDLSVGYQLASQQESDFWQINEQGFRDNEPLALEKPKDEIRVFLLGGSTAFGHWNEGNEATIAHKLEERINDRVTQQQRSPEKYRPDVFPFYQPDRVKAFALPPKIIEGKYRIINAAVPGYTSGNELAQFALKILPYQPDLIVLMDGYEDLLLPSRLEAKDIPHLDTYLENAPQHFAAYLSQPIKHWFNNLFIVKATKYWIVKPQPSIAEHSLVLAESKQPLSHYLATNDEELKSRVARYYVQHQQMVRLGAAAGVPIVLALQPEIANRSQQGTLSTSETAMLRELGSDYQKGIQQGYNLLLQASEKLEQAYPTNLKLLDLNTMYEKYPDKTFSDAIHLTEDANTAIAKQLYITITSLPKMQILPKNFNL